MTRKGYQPTNVPRNTITLHKNGNTVQDVSITCVVKVDNVPWWRCNHSVYCLSLTHFTKSYQMFDTWLTWLFAFFIFHSQSKYAYVTQQPCPPPFCCCATYCFPWQIASCLYLALSAALKTYMWSPYNVYLANDITKWPHLCLTSCFTRLVETKSLLRRSSSIWFRWVGKSSALSQPGTSAWKHRL